jgi:hypothetical protein
VPSNISQSSRIRVTHIDKVCPFDRACRSEIDVVADEYGCARFPIGSDAPARICHDESFCAARGGHARTVRNGSHTASVIEVASRAQQQNARARATAHTADCGDMAGHGWRDESWQFACRNLMCDRT